MGPYSDSCLLKPARSMNRWEGPLYTMGSFSLSESSCVCDGAPSLLRADIYAPFNIIFTERRTKRTAQKHQKEREEKKNGQRCRIDNTKREVLLGRALWFITNQGPSALETGECHRLWRNEHSRLSVCPVDKSNPDMEEKVNLSEQRQVYYYFNKDANKVKR